MDKSEKRDETAETSPESLIHPKDLRQMAQRACASLSADTPQVHVWEAGFKEGVRRTCSKNAEPLTRPENMLKKGENVNAFPSEEEFLGNYGGIARDALLTRYRWLKARMNGGRG